MNVIPSLYAIAIALCLFSSGIVSCRTAPSGRPLFGFMLYLGLESSCFVFELLMGHPATPLKALWQGLLMGTSLLIAPCLWFAIRESVAGTRVTLSDLSLPQRAVILAGITLTLPLIETAHFGTGFSEPHPLGRPLLEPVIHGTMLACLALFAAQVPFYLWRCRRILATARTSAGAPVANWLKLPLLIVGTTWLLGVARTLMGAASKGNEVFYALVAFVDISVTVGAVYLIVRRLANESLPRSQAPLAQGDAAAPALKYARSALDRAVRTRIRGKLERAFAAGELHRDSGLNLGQLSRHIGEPEHYVSQVINQDLDTTFYELVSFHRIEQAKRLLIEDRGRTVLEVALAVGFNAKSTFNTAFRRCTGMTPRQYRSLHLESHMSTS